MTKGCVLWTGATDQDGYGRMSHQGKSRKAHRVIWERAHGPIPKGMCVCHRCDVRACINLDCLFLGTHAENMADMVAKGRSYDRRGEENGRAVVTESQVRRIRADRRAVKVAARDYGLSPTQFCAIRLKRAWKHIGDES